MLLGDVFFAAGVMDWGGANVAGCACGCLLGRARKGGGGMSGGRLS